MNYSLSPFAPDKLVSRDGFGSPVPRRPAHLHAQAESGAYLQDSSGVRRRRPFIIDRYTLCTMNAAVHICTYSTMYLGTMISAALLLSFSVSSSNECPRIKQKCQGTTWKYNESRLDKSPYCVYGTLTADPHGNEKLKRKWSRSVVVFWDQIQLSLFMRGRY